MKADDIRCENDRKLASQLLKDSAVSAIKERIDRIEEKGPAGVRRHLLSSSVRLSHSISPVLHDMADHCIEKLGVKLPLELYVYSSPQFNAACFKPEEGRLYIMFSSSLLEAFTEDELMFVMGHEFGHHVYQHHDIPVGHILRGKTRPPANLALQLFAWSRYAEISADRAGALCAGNLDAVSRALFKLASGMRNIDPSSESQLVNFNLSEFLIQVDEMQTVDAEPGQGAPTQDWFSTHPFSPLRVKALQYYFNSELMKNGGLNKQDLELKVQQLMGVMEPDYLLGKTELAKLMRALFIAGSVAIANARNGISDLETQAIKEFLGDDFNLDVLNVDKLVDVLPKRIGLVKEKASVTQCLQLVRDLAVIAKAEQDVSDNEMIVLCQIADGLSVSRSFVMEFVNLDMELD